MWVDFINKNDLSIIDRLNTVEDQSTEAINKANKVDNTLTETLEKSSQAVEKSTDAINISNQALNQSTTAINGSNTALDKSSQAISLANESKLVSQQAEAKSNTAIENSERALRLAGQGGLNHKVNGEEVTFDGEIDLQGGAKIDVVKVDNSVVFNYNPDKVTLPVGMPKGAVLVDNGVNSYQIKDGKIYIEVAKIPTDYIKEYLYIGGSDYDNDGYEEEGASIVISAGFTGYFGSLYVFDYNTMTGVPIDTSKAVMEVDISQLGWSGSDIVTSARNNDAIYYVPNN